MYKFYVLELCDYIHKLVDKAYHYWYLDTQDNWYNIDTIKLIRLPGKDTNEKELPLVSATVEFGSSFDGNFKVDFYVDLTRSDDWNIGLISAKLQEAFDKDE